MMGTVGARMTPRGTFPRGWLVPVLGTCRQALLVAPFAVVTMAVFWILSRRLTHAAIPRDEQYFLWAGWSVLKGLIPYRDFMEYKPPGLFLTEALALELGGLAWMRYRYFFTFFTLSSVLALQLSAISRGMDRFLSVGLFAILSYFLLDPRYHDGGLNDAESIGLAYYYWGVAALLIRTRYRNLSDVLGGVCLSLCALSKEPFVPCVVATWVACFFYVDGTAQLRWRAARYAKFTLLGVALVAVGMLAYLGPTGGMAEYLKLLSNYRHFSDPNRSVCALQGYWKPEPTFALELIAKWQRLHAFFVNIAVLGVLVPFLALAAVFLAQQARAALTASLVALLAGLYAVTVTGCNWSHYYLLAHGGLFLFAVLGTCATGAALRESGSSLRWGIRAALLLPVLATIWPRLSADYGAEFVMPNSPVSSSLVSFVTRNSAPHDRIFTTSAPALYVFADRRSALRESAIYDEFLDWYPGTTRAEKLRPLREQLEGNPPRIIVVDRGDYLERRKIHHEELVMPFIRDHGYTEAIPDVFVRPASGVVSGPDR